MDPSRQIKVNKLAKELKVHPQNLKARLPQNNIGYGFSTITDADLDERVKEYCRLKPDSGLCYLTAHLWRQGLKLQKHWVAALQDHVDKLGRSLQNWCRKKATLRHPYKVARPHTLWHIDRHHKLILWGLLFMDVLMGILERFADSSHPFILKLKSLHSLDHRALCQYKQSSINSLTHVPCCSQKIWNAILCSGWSQLGKQACSYSPHYQRGCGWASFIWGSSTHKTRIEHLWVEVGSQFACAWRALGFQSTI